MTTTAPRTTDEALDDLVNILAAEQLEKQTGMRDTSDPLAYMMRPQRKEEAIQAIVDSIKASGNVTIPEDVLKQTALQMANAELANRNATAQQEQEQLAAAERQEEANRAANAPRTISAQQSAEVEDTLSKAVGKSNGGALDKEMKRYDRQENFLDRQAERKSKVGRIEAKREAKIAKAEHKFEARTSGIRGFVNRCVGRDLEFQLGKLADKELKINEKYDPKVKAAAEKVAPIEAARDAATIKRMEAEGKRQEVVDTAKTIVVESAAILADDRGELRKIDPRALQTIQAALKGAGVNMSLRDVDKVVHAAAPAANKTTQPAQSR